MYAYGRPYKTPLKISAAVNAFRHFGIQI
jgi:hypothetical protein